MTGKSDWFEGDKGESLNLGCWDDWQAPRLIHGCSDPEACVLGIKFRCVETG